MNRLPPGAFSKWSGKQRGAHTVRPAFHTSDCDLEGRRIDDGCSNRYGGFIETHIFGMNRIVRNSSNSHLSLNSRFRSCLVARFKNLIQNVSLLILLAVNRARHTTVIFVDVATGLNLTILFLLLYPSIRISYCIIT